MPAARDPPLRYRRWRTGRVISPENSLATCLASLAKRSVSSRALIEDCLEAAGEGDGEGRRVFVKTYEESARNVANSIDKVRRSGGAERPLLGVPISIKDLFDVEGETTCAGSVVLRDAPPARRDATVVARLRQAGAVLVGRTNMTEFAFSGLGLNPHFGTPRNPYDRAGGRISGGSSSGAAVSVSDGMAVAGIGSDTGGSIRIPAALCGLTGFKPTARRVPLDGVFPLSPSLDSIGWIAPTVDCCMRIDAILSSDALRASDGGPVAGMRLGVLQGCVLEGLERPVADAFEAALSSLSRAGADLVDVLFGGLNEIPEWNRHGGLAAAESYAWHRALIEREAGRYDPRVLSRILRGSEITPDDYRTLERNRRRIIADAERLFAEVDAWLLPTVPRIAPLIAELEGSDEAYFDANSAMLRNPSVFNFLDGCSLSLPCHRPGESPVGLMLAARTGDDARLLQVAAAVEVALADAGCAIQGKFRMNSRPYAERDKAIA